MTSPFTKLRSQFDWPLAGIMLIIIAIGLVNLYSATRVAPKGLYQNQIMWLCVGSVLFVVVAAIDYRIYERIAPIVYVLCLGLLVAVLVAGKGVKGSRRWFGFGSFGIQPSEVMKIGLILMLAKLLSADAQELRASGLRMVAWTLGIILVPAFLIYRQPDLGTAGLLYIIGMSMVLFSQMGGAAKAVELGLAPVLVLVRLAFGLKDYQKKRLAVFLDPQTDPSGAGYHARQSVYAIGSGRWSGKGYLHGTQNRLKFLPEHWTDFPFAVWAEEWGLAGSLVLLGCYLFLILWALGVSATARDRFGQVLALGVAALLFWHVVVNIGMVTGVLPVVGVTLPLFSYGGSSLLTVMIALGLLMNVSIRRYSY
ncbi:MAG TPA: rod shape-determining protein RodA [Polyangia bacterium]|nr:rod shape-determining protein RodA [Polyangia bacterium]